MENQLDVAPRTDNRRNGLFRLIALLWRPSLRRVGAGPPKQVWHLGMERMAVQHSAKERDFARGQMHVLD